MSGSNHRWELWAAITVNASSAVTAARAITSQTGQFNASLGATGISRVADGVWAVNLRAGQGVSGPDCYCIATPRATQYASADFGTHMSGGITMSVNHDSQTRKRVSIIALAREASGAAASYAVPVRTNVPFDLCIFRRIE